jgi:uncharacterized protein (TIGR02611 family)
MDHIKRKVKRIGIAVVGGLVVVLGIIAIPYPGPGWLIVFAGLAILATEFEWARRLLERARGEYDKWQLWLKHQPMAIRLLVVLLTGIIVIATMWLFNVFGLLDSIFNLHSQQIHSPLGIFK